ncbi:protein of unknown function [Thauera humireducens]|uniref:hypothetical protein n=1 Tax=Thauera humireducens TaxID=1134435 RepID=UPI002467A647|nr:hypothetical protein [Thauera humireducens]CAH1748278.1 protein of unknown function [Thauera humireducens]
MKTPNPRNGKAGVPEARRKNTTPDLVPAPGLLSAAPAPILPRPGIVKAAALAAIIEGKITQAGFIAPELLGWIALAAVAGLMLAGGA